EDVNALVSAADLLQESQALTAPCQGVCQSLASAPAVKRLIAILHQGVPPGRFKDPILESGSSLWGSRPSTLCRSSDSALAAAAG
ncbi:unnamed protein product, partial [Effrenium voratum]